MSIFDRDFSKINAAIVASGSATQARNVLQAALDEIALLRKERVALVEVVTEVIKAIAEDKSVVKSGAYQSDDAAWLVERARAALKLAGVEG